jgi:release factor glutamine methyltransferase
VAEAPAWAPATVGALLSAASAALRDAGCETPRLDAELLLGEALGVGRSQLLLDAGAPVAEPARERFEALFARRRAREPVAYILGRRAFRRLTLSVDRRVLVPRPETELLVEVGVGLPRGWRVADVGTGSGAVALALADERTDLQLTGLDLSADALAVARENAARLGLCGVRWARADLLDAAPYDAVLANLPYVEEGAELAPEVACHEPPGALFAGRDGLSLIRRLALEVLAARADVRVAALEVGAGQASLVQAMLASAGFGSVQTLRDLAGHERVLVARR